MEFKLKCVCKEVDCKKELSVIKDESLQKRNCIELSISDKDGIFAVKSGIIIPIKSLKEILKRL